MTPENMLKEGRLDEALQGLTSQVQESEAALRFQERQTTEQIQQAEATLASKEGSTTAGKTGAEGPEPPDAEDREPVETG